MQQQQPRDFSLHGAVDLGARQAAQRRQAARSAGNGETPDEHQGNVIEVTDDTFNAQVVERSRSVPVVLDLWAEWCGPCKQLGPVLEKLAGEADGAWVLAKVDVDANPQLSAALQVQSIPMVVAVAAGQIVEAFLGAMPESQVREWLGAVMQIADQLGLPGYGGAEAGDEDAESESTAATDGGTAAGQARPGQPQPGQARSAQTAPAQTAPAQTPPGQVPPAFGGPGRGRPGQARPGQARPGQPPPRQPQGPSGRPGPGRPGPGSGPEQGAFMADPAFGEAQQAMERGDLDGAAAAFEKVLASSPGHPVATMGMAQVDLIKRVNSYDQPKVQREADDNPGDPDAQARAADVDVALGRVDAGFNRLLETVRRTSGDERNRARLHLVNLFNVFPPKDQRVAKARATLSSLLF